MSVKFSIEEVYIPKKKVEMVAKNIADKSVS